MNFLGLFYQSALFAVCFWLYNRIFARYVLKNSDSVFQPLGVMIRSMLLYFCVFFSLQFVIEKYIVGDRSADAPIVKQEIQLISGQALMAPVSDGILKPLNLQTDFACFDEQDEQTTQVSTNLATYTFSNRNGCLKSMDLAWKHGSKSIALLSENSYQNFAVAFDGQSPSVYRLVSCEPVMDGKAQEVVYETVGRHGLQVQKKYVVYQDTYQMDVSVSVQGCADQESMRLLLPTIVPQDELQGVVNKATTSENMKFSLINLSKKDSFQQFWFEPKLFGFSGKFFTCVCFAMSDQALGRVYFKQVAPQQYQAVLESKSFAKSAHMSWSIYCGPKAEHELQQVCAPLVGLIDFGILSPLAKPLAWLLHYTKDKVGSYGWAIILVALLIKLLMLPFTLRSERSMRQQAEIEKKRAYLAQKFKHDKAARDQAMTELFQKHGMPMFSGCLPMLLNIPVLIALNKVLTSSTELLGVSFLWLPDLAASDPYYILSIFVFVGMLLAPMGTQGGERQFFSRAGMALFVAAFSAYLASGLTLFIILNSFFSVLQSWAVRHIRWLRVRYAA